MTKPETFPSPCPHHPINTQAAWHPWLRPVARVVIGAHLALALQPLSALAQEPGASADSPVAQAQVQRLFQWQQKLNLAQATKALASLAASSSSTSTAASDRTARNLGRAQDLVRSLRRASGTASGGISTAKAMATPSLIAKATTTVDAETQALSSALDAIDADTDAALAEFHHLRQGLIQQGVSNDILLRHDQTEAELQTRANTLRSLIQAWRTGPSSAKLAAISDYFDRYPAGKKPLALDPQKLPWSTPKPNTRAPATTQTAWFQNLYGKESVRLAQAGGSVGPIQFNIPPAPGEAPTAADLAPTPEVQLTAAIQAQAQALGNNPVNIHNWVRNQVEWVPTWGSIQGAQDTLDKKRGNAFDIASLEIALLRAAHIPARYQLGTVEIPAAQAMNWVGGVQTPEAAVILLNQGGIAATSVRSDGKLRAIRMEHVWVQAYVNWAPGRGSQNASANQHVNPNGALNAWVPLDASYKQYQFAMGMNLRASVPLDPTALLAAIQQESTTVNAEQGWVQNLSYVGVQTQLAAYQARLQAYVDRQQPDAGLIDVFGQKRINSLASKLLSDALPYSVITSFGQSTSVPEPMRWRLSLKLYGSTNDRAEDHPILTAPLLLSDIGINRLTASAVAASPEDQVVLNQYIQANASALPIYLLRQKVQIKLDEQVLAESSPQRMGSTQLWSYVLSGPNFGSVEEDFKYESSVGDAIAFSIDAIGFRYQDAAQRAARVNPDSALENLHQIGLGYWSRANEADALMAREGHVVTTRLPSIGMFTSPLTVTYSWGVPRVGQYNSYAVDIRRLSYAIAGIYSPADTHGYLQQAGARYSYLEGRIFEEMLGLAPNAAASAVSVMAAAVEQGVPVWQLNANNLAQYLAVSTVSLNTQQQVVDAVSNGLDVLVPQSPVELMRWTGQGYIATDPQTGAGAYIIDGVGNGGELMTCEVKVEPLVEALAQRILTKMAMRLALLLMAELGLATAGTAFPPTAPVMAQAMVMVGISFLTFSAEAASAGCAKASKDCHRGTIQAQGQDIIGNRGTRSIGWARPDPFTVSDGVEMLYAVKGLLSPAQLFDRADYFIDAEGWIKSRPPYGVCGGGPTSSFGPDPKNKRHVKYEIRVDIKVYAGEAFKR